ncbi:hypothetical protein ABFX02_14G277600 [Erythranthe guttata]
MKGREAAGKGPPSADLLVCFPTRAHLRLMPKPICSPSRPSDTSTRRHQHHPRQHHPQPFPHHHRRNKSSGGGHASPVLWAKTKASNHHQNSDMSEPTSPKVTCAGQIKVRPSKPSSCKNWQSVMEEIERLHNHRKQKKRSAWTDALGFKKDVMQFLTCLRNVRFDFRCFGSYPTAVLSSDDDDDDDDDDVDDDDEVYEKKVGPKEESDCNNNNNSGDVFSKWFMILQEDRGKEFVSREEEAGKGKMIGSCLVDEDEDEDGGSAAAPPPANALLLMRCRSAPAKSWLEEREEEEEREKEEQGVVVMRCGTEFSKLSDDIAKETWIVGAGGIKDMLSRSTSSRR